MKLDFENWVDENTKAEYDYPHRMNDPDAVDYLQHQSRYLIGFTNEVKFEYQGTDWKAIARHTDNIYMVDEYIQQPYILLCINHTFHPRRIDQDLPLVIPDILTHKGRYGYWIMRFAIPTITIGE